jgi:UDP:flavonoid glycosyltransferase YjiC (YdhE family)
VRIALATVGTTGDVRPFAALARGLSKAGHDVTAVSWELHRATLEPAAERFVAAGPETTWDDVRATAERAASAPSPLAQVAVLQDFHLREATAHYAALREALTGSDLVVLHGIHSLAEAAVRDLGLPWASAVFDPVLLPTRSAPPAGMPSLGPFNGIGWWMLDRTLRRQDGPLRAALEEAGSPSAAAVTMFRARSSLLHLVACSPAIAPPPPDAPAAVHFTGAWPGDDAPEPLAPALSAFLAVPEPTVVVTFGSMVGGDAAEIGAAVREAIQSVGVRAVIQEGVAGLGGPADEERIIVVGPADHRLLLPRAAAVVHHGGAGTTHAVAGAGVPSVVVPHVGDQPYWAARLHRLGVAPEPLPVRRLTAAELTARLRATLDDEAMRARATELGARVREERGTATAVALVEAAARSSARRS